MKEPCLAVCRQCSLLVGHPRPVPFLDTVERDEWLARHAALGHDVRPVNGWIPLREAYTTAFGEPW